MSISEILKKAGNSEEISPEEALALLKVTGRDFIDLQRVANQICFEKKEDVVTFVVNRNINFTNTCTQVCKFCSFSVPPNSSEAFLLSHDQIKEKVLEAKKNNCSEVCMQGGIHPDFLSSFNVFSILSPFNCDM